MRKPVYRPGSLVLAWLSVFLVVFGSLWWLPAAAQDATPEAEPTTAVEPTNPPPVDPPPVQPTAPVVDPAEVEEPAAAPAAPGSRLTTLAALRVTAIELECRVSSPRIDGVVTVSDPQAASITLQLQTSLGSVTVPLHDLAIAVIPGQASYPFTVELETGDYPLSSSKRVEVAGPDGTPVSEPIAITQDGGKTVCVPEGATSPTVPVATEATATATATGSATLVPTGTAPATPTVTVGNVSNTGTSNLRCRAEPNTSSAIIAQLPPGQRVDVRGAAVNGWVPVRCANQDGWVSADYLTISTAPASSATPVATATATASPSATAAPGLITYGTVSNTGGSNLRCRTAPNTSASVITLLPSGQRVETRGPAVNGWLPVRCGGQDGWVSSGYMVLSTGSATPTAPAPATSTPLTPTTPAPGGSQMATVSGTGGAGLRCRAAPVFGSVISVLPEMARVETVGAQQNGWIQARCAGQLGWVSVTYLVFNVGTGGGSGEIWMDVNLSTQYMVVYQGTSVIGRTYVSTGRPGFDTPTGTYYINRKVPVKDMTGTLGGEYYYVHDVPHVMYFTNRGHAIHGAYWHNNFGYRMSHGCINLPVNFASWLYSITPMGARVRIHY